MIFIQETTYNLHVHSKYSPISRLIKVTPKSYLQDRPAININQRRRPPANVTEFFNVLSFSSVGKPPSSHHLHKYLSYGAAENGSGGGGQLRSHPKGKQEFFSQDSN